MVTAATALRDVRFDYSMHAINDLAVETKEDAKTGRKVVQTVIANDEPLKPSQRFWTSLYARFGFGDTVFKFFDHDEVFTRISERCPSDRLRLCVERTTKDDGTLVSTLMGVSAPTKPVVVFDDLVDTLERYNGVGVNYANGEVESTHSPRVGAGNFSIAGDLFSNRFVMSTPIDGYGTPSMFLSLLRQICENGMVGMSRAFKSSMNLGKASDDVFPTITRALDSFGNDEGFASLRQRVETAAKSWASVHESTDLYKMIIKLHNGKHLPGQDSLLQKGNLLHGYMVDSRDRSLFGDAEVACPTLTAFHRMTGDINATYGLANIDALSAKRQRTLPVKCTVYDLINFTTELATHYATSIGGRQLQALVGGLISQEYDMENTKDDFEDFADFLMDAKLKTNLTGSRN